MDTTPTKADGIEDANLAGTSEASVADVAKSLRLAADELHELLVVTEAPPRHQRCAEILRDAAIVLQGEFAKFPHEPIQLDGNQSHELRNLLNHLYQPLQRLERLDSDTTLESLALALAEMRGFYNRLFNAVQSGFASVPDKEDAVLAPQPNAESDSSILMMMNPDRETGRVLIVDDDWRACSVLEETIEDYGHVATSCRRPERVIDLIREGTFDVCLLDVNMPTMSGWDLLQKIKADPTTKHTSVIVVSGSEKDKSATKAITLGADDFISKPVNSSLLAARISNCLLRSRQHLHELTKFLPSSVVDVIRKDPRRLERGQEATVTVMFCDIRRFSRFSEQMSPSETIRWISDVMENLSLRILEDGGTLIDFVGDEVFAMWGAPQPSGDHAESACRCALRIQETVNELNRRWEDTLGDRMEIGIGIHSGIVSVGNTGSPQRFKYGPLGNTVNLGSRVQGASKYLRSEILITRDTRRQIPRDMAARRLCSVRVNNIERPVELFELTTDTSPKAKSRDAAYEEALIDFEASEFSEAIGKLARILTDNPDDGPTLLLMNRLIEAKLSGESHFDPIWSLPGK